MTETADFDEYLKERMDKNICPNCDDHLIVTGCHAICINCGFKYDCSD